MRWGEVMREGWLGGEVMEECCVSKRGWLMRHAEKIAHRVRAQSLPTLLTHAESASPMPDAPLLFECHV